MQVWPIGGNKSAAASKKKAPEVEDIRKRFIAYKDYYEQLHTNQKTADDFYELDYDAGVPEEYPTRMPDTARNWVDAGVRH